MVEWISLGYTTLRTPDGRSVVLPNSVAANQVTLNLSSTYVPAQTAVSIRCARSVEPPKVCELATAAATEILGAQFVNGCFLTKIDATGAVFDLRVLMPDLATRESTRARLLAHLAQRFAAADLGGAATEPPTFS